MQDEHRSCILLDAFQRLHLSNGRFKVWPKQVAAGRDPQLEKAVEIALAQIEKNPPQKRPGYKPPDSRCVDAMPARS